jgi:membrane protein implicated in regulation of membrane protease activity
LMDAEAWRWVWLGVAGACAVGELAVPGTFFVLSFAVGAVIAAALAFLDVSVGAQWAAFVASSGTALLLLAPLARRLAQQESDEPQEGATRWVGRVGVVVEEIPGSPHSTGQVRVERDLWRAETDAGELIPVDARVEVLAVRGTRLVVAPVRASTS